VDGRDVAPFYIDYLGTEPNGTAVVTLHGDLNRFSAREARSTLCLIGYVFSGVVVDLSAVTSCDASGAAALVEADEYLRSRDCSLVLRHPPADVAQILHSVAVELTLEGA
jgi:anti-anti-sigma regulatory factor